MQPFRCSTSFNLHTSKFLQTSRNKFKAWKPERRELSGHHQNTLFNFCDNLNVNYCIYPEKKDLHWFHCKHLIDLTDNLHKLGSDWWLVLLSSPSLSCISWCSCRFTHAGLCIWGPPIHGRSCTWTHNTGSFMLLRQTAQCTAMTKQGSCALPHIPLACSMNADHPPPTPPKHCQASLTGTIPPQHTLRPRPYTHLICRQTPHLSRRPLAVPSEYIKKSSPLSGSSWPCYTKCYCHRESCTAAATVKDLITAKREAYRRFEHREPHGMTASSHRVTDY